MASTLKRFGRGLLRFYLTYTPVKKGRYPLMVAFHKYFTEPITVKVKTKDRGIMILRLDDEMQWRMYYNMYENVYLHVMNSLVEGANVAIDAGANIGQYALLFAKSVKKVYAFEPMPVMIEILNKHVFLNHLESKIELIPLALSNTNGRLYLSVPPSENSGAATTVMADKRESYADEIAQNYFDEKIKVDEKGQIQATEIESIRLDDFMEQKKINCVDLIKMDIEGAELFALQGMPKLLAKPDKPILVLEMNDNAMRLAGYYFKDVADFLAPFGYKAYEITKKGLRYSPEIHSKSENYCFLTPEHLQMEKVKRVLMK